jgi:hypothetical protein
MEKVHGGAQGPRRDRLQNRARQGNSVSLPSPPLSQNSCSPPLLLPRVTRLIKAASKSASSASSNRESLMSPNTATYHPRSPSASTISISDDNHSTMSLPTASRKLAAAQTELQACEAQLSLKEKELETKRHTAIIQGMSYRCRALMDCGKVWADMGAQLLALLQQHRA